MGVLIFGLFLWWIMVVFDVKTVDYNMLTRIQEKIWRLLMVVYWDFFWMWNGEAGTVPSVSFCMELESSLSDLHWQVN